MKNHIFNIISSLIAFYIPFQIALLTDYSFKKNTNIFFDTSAKKTNSKQETYSLNIGFKSKF